MNRKIFCPDTGEACFDYNEYLNSRHWRSIRCTVLRSAGGRCRVCGFRSPKNHAHHRTYERLGAEWPDDLVILCDRHHRELHRRVDAGMPLYDAHNLINFSICRPTKKGRMSKRRRRHERRMARKNRGIAPMHKPRFVSYTEYASKQYEYLP